MTKSPTVSLPAPMSATAIAITLTSATVSRKLWPMFSSASERAVRRAASSYPAMAPS